MSSVGYVRQDTTNQIDNSKIIDATYLDQEFNAVEAAFSSTAGHTHDGSSAQGAPITKIGPAQDLIVSSTTVLPKTTNVLDLGSASFGFKDFWALGTSTLSTLVATTADINAGTIDATVIGATTPAAATVTSLTATSGTIGGSNIATTTSTTTFTNKTINLTDNTLVATSAQLATALTDETGSGSVVFSGSPTLTGTPLAPTAVAGTNTTQIATTAHVFAERTNTSTLTNKTLSAPSVTGQALFADGSAASPSFALTNATNTGLYKVSGSAALGVSTSGIASTVFLSNGNVRISPSGAVGSFPASMAGALQVHGISTNAAISGMRVSADTTGMVISAGKSRGTSEGDYTIVQTGDLPFVINTYGADGSTIVFSSAIRSQVEGTPVLGDVRSGWRFFTGNGAGTVGQSLWLDTNQAVLATNSTGGLGYGTGAGGTVTQATSKTTSVTLNKVCGAITMNGASLAANTLVRFTWNNSIIAATDVAYVSVLGFTGKYTAGINIVGAGSAEVWVRNETGSPLSEAITLNVMVLRAVTA